MDPELYKRGESYLGSEQEAWVLWFLSALDCVYGLTMVAGVLVLSSSKQWTQNLGVFSIAAVRGFKDIYNRVGY